MKTAAREYSRTLTLVLRWLCVPPAALLGELAVDLSFRAALNTVRSSEWSFLSGVNSSAFGFLHNGLLKFAFVFVGALLGPKYRRETARVLVIVAILLAALTHLLGPSFAGHRIGTGNVTDFFAEAAGAFCGAACFGWYDRKTQDPCAAA